MRNIEIYARPDQSLKRHIMNMLIAYNEVRKNNLIFLFDTFLKDFNKNQARNLLNSFHEISIIAHDFGKLSPYFQKRMQKQRISSDEVPLSFHVQTSSIFGYLLAKAFYCAFFGDTDSKNTDFDVINYYKAILPISCFYIILSHHSKVLSDFDYTIIDKLSFSQHEDIIKEIIHAIKEEYPLTFLKDYFQDVLDCCKTNISSNLLILTIETFLDSTEESIEYTIGEIDNFLLSFQKDITEKSPLYFFILYSYSILCDLDQWDAIFHIKNKKLHYCPFYNDFEQFDRILMNENLIDNYKEMCIESGEWDLEQIDPRILVLRNETYQQANKSLFQYLTTRLKSGVLILQAPTGSGKTLTFLNTAFKIKKYLFNQDEISRKIIYCLPFISIIDQVGEQIQQILKLKTAKQSEYLTLHHHLADIDWIDHSKQSGIKNSIVPKRRTFLIEQWHSAIIVTTFVKIWEALLNSYKQKILRINRIANSIIIFDEMQAIPTRYWKVIGKVIDILVQEMNCQIIIGTATLPYLPLQMEKVDLVKYEKITLQKINRYRVHFDFTKKELCTFWEEITDYIENQKPSSLMIVLNTRRSAKETIEFLQNRLPDDNDFFFLTTYLAPIHRIKQIEQIKTVLSSNLKEPSKKTKPVILVCTQIIEAGVDISFEHVFRDFAPLDSIIQVCGRCNRGFEYQHVCDVKVLKLCDKGQPFSNIYDTVLLESTEQLLKEKDKSWQEVELRDIIPRYYAKAKQKKKIDEGLTQLSKLHYNQINSKFQLIKQRNEKFVLIETILNNKIKEYLEVISDNKSEGMIRVPRDFYKFGINLSAAIINKIEKQLMSIGDRKKKLRKQGDEILFYVLKRNSSLYSEETGFSIEMI